MANNRIFYAIQAVKIKPCRLVGTTWTYGSNIRTVRGVQSVGINSTFNLEQAYQLGQLSLYENIENVPDVEVTISKALDGTRAVYNLATDGNDDSGNNLALTEIADRRCDVALGIWDDTDVNTSGDATYFVTCTGMYVSNVSYNFTSDGNFTEDVTLVGNHKKWGGAGGITSMTTAISGDETKVMHRRWSLDTSTSLLPTGVSGGIPGAFESGTLHINSITLSCSLGRESINELGRRAPYYRFVSFPVEVTSEFEVTATEGDKVDADDFANVTGCSQATSANLVTKSIKVVLCPLNGTSTGYTIDLGTKNKLTSVNYTGGDTGGGNATITYSYQTFNDFKVISPSGI